MAPGYEGESGFLLPHWELGLRGVEVPDRCAPAAELSAGTGGWFLLLAGWVASKVCVVRVPVPVPLPMSSDMRLASEAWPMERDFLCRDDLLLLFLTSSLIFSIVVFLQKVVLGLFAWDARRWLCRRNKDLSLLLEYARLQQRYPSLARLSASALLPTKIVIAFSGRLALL